MQKNSVSWLRVISGLGLFIIGIASLAVIFNPKGLLISFDDRPIFMLVIFGISFAVGFGGWLLSQYPLRMFLEPFLIVTLWVFLFVLPILMLPLSIDMLSLVLGFSLLLLVFVYGNYSRWREKRRKDTQKLQNQKN